MRWPKLGTLWLLFNVAFGLTLMTLIYFSLYLLLTTIIGRTAAGILISVCTALAVPAVAYGL